MHRFLNEEAVRCNAVSRAGHHWEQLLPSLRFCPAETARG